MYRKPFLSLVIPYYNSAEATLRLLESIRRSKKAPVYEVIVVDDGSAQAFKVLRSKFKNSQCVRIIVLRLDRNQGPAIARNRGVDAARGKFIVFLDSDVEVFDDTLHNLANVYLDDPDIVALTGVWVKQQRSRAFFPNFKALRDWSYWINERDKSGYYFLFSTRIASIKRSVFVRLGGFDEMYPAPLVEDIELTYRIARRYAIIFAPHVRVRHEFEGFWPIAKKYFLRSYYWTRLYDRRKKFDPVATTWWEAVSTLSAVGTVGFGLVSLMSLPGLPLVVSASSDAPKLFVQLATINYQLFILFLVIHIFLVRKFLVFIYGQKGPIFTFKSFLMGIVLYCFIFSGAFWGKLRSGILGQSN